MLCIFHIMYVLLTFYVPDVLMQIKGVGRQGAAVPVLAERVLLRTVVPHRSHSESRPKTSSFVQLFATRFRFHSVRTAVHCASQTCVPHFF